MENSTLKSVTRGRPLYSLGIVGYMPRLLLLFLLGGAGFNFVAWMRQPYLISYEQPLTGIFHQLHQETGLAMQPHPFNSPASSAYILEIRYGYPGPRSITLGRIPLFPAVNIWNVVDDVTKEDLNQLTHGSIDRWDLVGGINRRVLRNSGSTVKPGDFVASNQRAFAWLDWTELRPGVKVLSVNGVNPLWDRLNAGYPYWRYVTLRLPQDQRGIERIRRWMLLKRIQHCFSKERWLYGTEKATVTVVGDMLFDRGVYKRVSEGERGYFYLFQRSAPHLVNSDITVGNLECPLSRRGRQINMFRGEPAVAEALRQAGFDLIALANNHILDYGTGALEDTLTILKRQGIASVGAGRNIAEAGKSRDWVINGVPMAFFAYTEVRPGFTYARVPIEWRAGPDRPGVNPLTTTSNLSEIRLAKERGCQVVVSVHWGTEYQLEPNSFQRRMAERLKAAGADLIVGHHPHVTQGIAIGLQSVAFSLGNFIFDQKHLERREGLILDALFDREGLKLIRLHPIRIVRERPMLLKGNDRRFMLIRVAKASKGLN